MIKRGYLGRKRLGYVCVPWLFHSSSIFKLNFLLAFLLTLQGLGEMLAEARNDLLFLEFICFTEYALRSSSDHTDWSIEVISVHREALV